MISANYGPINLGQLKAVSKPYYDLLLSYGYNTKANLIAHGAPSDWAYDYPWNPSTDVSANYAPANLGQLKLVFSFDLTSYDADDNGIPDIWEYNHYGWYGIDPAGDDDGDGLTNLQEYEQSSDPNDYYSQASTTVVPYLAISGGNNQEGGEGDYLANPLVVTVRSGSSTGALLAGAPVIFTVTTGSGGLSSDNESDYTSSTLTVATGTTGAAQVYYREGAAGVINVVTAQTGTSASVTFQSQAIGANDLVAHFQFDGTSGTVATDVGPFAFTGTLINGPTWTTRYTGEGSLSLDGSNDYVKVGTGTSSILDFGSNSFSLVAWIKSGTDGQAGRIISKGQANSTAGYELAITGSGQIEAGLGTTQTGTSAETILIQTTGSASFHDGNWHQVAAVFDRANSQAQIYVDGTSKALTQVVSTGGTIHTGTTNILDFAALTHLSGSNSSIPLTISSHNGSQDYFKGGVDDVRVYRKALSDAEVVRIRDEESVLAATTTTENVYEDTLGVFDLQSKGGGITSPVFAITGSTSNGYITLDGSTVNYYPNAHWSGTDSFEYQVTKGARVSSGTTTLIVAAVNNPPLVSVGGGQSIVLPNTLSLTGVVTDIDSGTSISLQWIKVSGTGTVTFSDTNALSTTATFSTPGQYVLRLAANDGKSTRSDSLVVMVNSSSATPPTVSLHAPTDNSAVTLSGTVNIQAQAVASGSGASISKVEFFEGSRKIGEATTPTGTSGYYQLNWVPTSLGAFALSALATENTGDVQFSDMKAVRITQDGWFTGTNSKPGNDGHSGSGGDEELICTGEHPFFEIRRNKFIPACEIESGSRLRLLGGTSAHVTGIIEEETKGAISFTTYNFEVEDFHTYFVGKSGVWVHNSAKTPCEQAAATFIRCLKRDGDVWTAYSNAFIKLPSQTNKQVNLGIFNEARREFFAGAPGLNPPWHNLSVQQRLGKGTSEALTKNLKRVGVLTPGEGRFAAHHLVAKGDERATAVRAILQREGIDIDEAANGVFLPRDAEYEKQLPGFGPPHSKIHTDAYYIALSDRLSSVPSGQVRDELQKIASELIEGTFPW
ncbi:hypothetical protein BH09VER1_BH09VER1_23980 [soil metagenome]